MDVATPSDVLVIDDSPEDRGSTRRHLEADPAGGYAVREAATGQDGLAACRDRPPACVVLDFGLPDMSGLEFLDELTGPGGEPPCPVVMLTGRGSEDVAVQALKRGALDYLGKGSFTGDRLRRAVADAIAKFAHRPVTERQRAEMERVHRDAQDAARPTERLVLIVDDSPEDRETARRYLGQSQSVRYRFLELGTADEGLAVCRSAGLDCLLLDFSLPDLDGLEFLDALTGGSGVASFPVIMLTGRGDEATAVRALKGGATDYLVKGRFSAAQLQATVDHAIGRVAARRAEAQRRIGELEGLERAARERAELLVQADRRKDEFLAMLAHELRNPLAPVRNALHVVRAYVGDRPEAGRALDIAQRQVEVLAHLVDDLLDVSRIDRDKIRLRVEPLNLSLVARRAADAVQPLIDARGHRFEMRLPADPVGVAGDATRLEQVLVNLLTNAAKYTAPGGAVTLAVTAEADQAVVRVADTGAGIAADMLPRVFELFAQVDRSLDRADGGLGIGLTLAKRLVELHGGTIAAASDGPDRGSTFTVRLPLTAYVSPTAAAASPVGAAALRVLLVEDHLDGAAMLATLMRLWGHSVDIAHDGGTGLAAALARPFDTVVLDIGLPIKTGYEVAAALRATEATRDLRLIALTGYGQAEDRQRVAAAGFDAHLVKPVDPQELQRLLSGPPSVN